MKKFIAAAVLCGLLTLYFIMDGMRTNAAIAEWWVRHVQAAWEVAIGSVTSIFHLSIFELCIAALVILAEDLYVMLVISLCRKRFGAIATGLLTLGIAAAVVLDAYMLSMGFGYYRAPMPMYYAGADYDAAQAAAACEYFLNDYNELAASLERDENGCVVCPYSFRELAKKLQEEYARLDDGYFNKYTPVAKEVVNSRLMSDTLILGITFLPTGEANVNTEAAPVEYAFTMAHELAHAKGVQREGDANLLAQYILLSSDDPFLRYCAYYDSIGSLFQSVMLAGDRETYIKLSSSVDPIVKTERAYVFDFWISQPDVIGQISETFNNIYLKLNGATNGTGSYGDGNKTDVVIPIEPDTGDPVTDPDTGNPVVIPVYSSSQKIYFYLYENRPLVEPVHTP